MNLSLYANLTDDELIRLSGSVYNAAVRLFDRATAIHAEMGAVPSWTEQYGALHSTARIVMSAGREANDLHREIMDTVRARAVVAGTHLLPGDRHQAVKVTGPAAPYRAPWED